MDEHEGKEEDKPSFNSGMVKVAQERLDGDLDTSAIPPTQIPIIQVRKSSSNNRLLQEHVVKHSVNVFIQGTQFNKNVNVSKSDLGVASKYKLNPPAHCDTPRIVK